MGTVQKFGPGADDGRHKLGDRVGVKVSESVEGSEGYWYIACMRRSGIVTMIIDAS